MERVILLLIFPLVSALLFTAAFPPYNAWYLSYIALVPLLYLIITAKRPGTVKYAGIIFGFILYAWNLRWFLNIFSNAAVALWIILALLQSIFAVVLYHTKKRYGYKNALIAAPFIWLGIEFFRSEIWALRFGWITPGLSQAGSLAMIQMANIVGAYGATFFVVAINSVITYSFLTQRAFSSRIIPCIFSISLIFIIYLLGEKRLSTKHIGEIPVGLVQYETNLLGDGLSLSEQLPGDMKIIAWPELSVLDEPLNSPKIDKTLSEFARLKKSILIVGGREWFGQGENDFYNSVVVYDEDGEKLGRYVKGAPIPLFIDGVAGNDFTGYQTKLGKIGIGICYDLDNPQILHQTINNGAELLVVPTADPISWSHLQHEQHSISGIVRAIEYGRWIVRPSTSGYSQIIDPHGIVHVALPIAKTGAIHGKVTFLSEKTVYTNFGRFLPWFSLLFTSFIIVLLLAGSFKHA